MKTHLPVGQYLSKSLITSLKKRMTKEEKKSEAKKKEDDDKRKGEDMRKDAMKGTAVCFLLFSPLVFFVFMFLFYHTGRMSSTTSSTIELDEDKIDMDNESSGHKVNR